MIRLSWHYAQLCTLIMHIELCTLHYAHCTMCIALYMLHYTHCTMHIALCLLHCAHCTMYIVLCELHYVHCTMQSCNIKKKVTSKQTDKATSSLLVAAKIEYFLNVKTLLLVPLWFLLIHCFTKEKLVVSLAIICAHTSLSWTIIFIHYLLMENTGEFCW